MVKGQRWEMQLKATWQWGGFVGEERLLGGWDPRTCKGVEGEGLTGNLRGLLEPYKILVILGGSSQWM